MFSKAKVTEIYCIANGFCKEFAKVQEKYIVKDLNHKHQNSLNRMDNAEIIVILILFRLGGFRCIKYYCEEYVYKHLMRLFPIRMSYNRFVELEKEVLLQLTVFIKKILLDTDTRISFMDSTSLFVCQNQFIVIHKTFEGLAEHRK